MNSELTKRAKRHHEDAVISITDLLEHDLSVNGSIEMGHMFHLADEGRPLLSGLFAFEDDDEKDLAFSYLGTMWGCHPTANTMTVQLDTTLTEDSGEYAGDEAVAVYTTEFEEISGAVIFNRRVTVIRYWVEDGELHTDDVTEELGVNDMPARSMDILERIFSACRADEIEALQGIPTVGFQRFVQAVGHSMTRMDMVVLPLPDFEIQIVKEMVDAYGIDQFVEAREGFGPLRALTPHCMVVDNRPEARRN